MLPALTERIPRPKRGDKHRYYQSILEHAQSDRGWSRNYKLLITSNT